MTELAGPRVLLREFDESDLDETLKILGDERVTYWLSFDKRDRSSLQTMLRDIAQRAKAEPRNEYYFAIVSKDANRLVGFIRLGLGGVKAAKLGYALGADYWGRGFGTEAVSVMLDFAFGRLGLHRVTAAIGPDNNRSIAVVDRIGFKYEGRLRDHVFTNGSWRDSLLYALVEDDRRVFDS